jgi:uncharacterized protein YkwD
MRMILLSFVVFLVSCQDSTQPEVEPADVSFRSEMLEIVNDQRAAGCTCGNQYMAPVGPLIWDDQLAAAAARHATDMSQNEFFGHQGSDGSDVSQRVADTGYQWRAVGENISFGYYSVEATMQAWVESPTHCKLLMSENFTEMGGARSGTYWVQTFGDAAK